MAGIIEPGHAAGDAADVERQNPAGRRTGRRSSRRRRGVPPSRQRRPLLGGLGRRRHHAVGRIGNHPGAAVRGVVVLVRVLRPGPGVVLGRAADHCPPSPRCAPAASPSGGPVRPASRPAARRPANSAGRCIGMPLSLVLVYVPCRSGSPHGVRVTRASTAVGPRTRRLPVEIRHQAPRQRRAHQARQPQVPLPSSTHGYSFPLNQPITRPTRS